MSRHHSHLNSAASILRSYVGNVPFAQALKKFFSAHKKYGSKDRRQIGHLCYGYFRAYHLLTEVSSIEEKILLSYLLCNTESSPFIETLKPEWMAYQSLSCSEKCNIFKLDITRLFPHVDMIEKEIDAADFCTEHLTQPDLFIRIRPGQTEKVLNVLSETGINYRDLGEDCISLANQTKIEEYLKINKDIVVQDYASQRVGKILTHVKSLFKSQTGQLKVWDCCAASGGKSILAVDVLGAIELTVSDVRERILQNLRTRFDQAGIHGYQCLTLDLENVNSFSSLPPQDLIIADVPCSGSGTWSRTPERLHQCDLDEVQSYAAIQKRICDNISTKLKSGAYLLYITCSVYRQENSEVVSHLVDEHGLDIIETTIYRGYELHADTMYATLLQRK